ncbi:MAG: hypothetical protein ACRDHO_03330 [Actinomycetota bacterium]
MIPEELENVTTEGISRRRMIKRIGAGAAIAWSAPILTSIRTPAFAETPPDDACPDTGCPGENFAPCTGNPSGCAEGACTGGLGCFKGDDTEGGCHCYQNIFCSCVSACTSSADCGDRQFCMLNTGCGSGGVCINCCGEGCRDASGRSRPRGATARR